MLGILLGVTPESCFKMREYHCCSLPDVDLGAFKEIVILSLERWKPEGVPESENAHQTGR